jgi:hypothetical protein
MFKYFSEPHASDSYRDCEFRMKMWHEEDVTYVKAGVHKSRAINFVL